MAATTSSLLLDLPKELRLIIYEHVYPLHGPERSINIFDTRPPSKALTLSCKQINHEVGNLYKTSFRHFWENSKFDLVYDVARPHRTRAGILSLSEADIKHTNHLSIPKCFEDRFASSSLVHNNGGWRIVLGDKTFFRRYRVALFRETPKSECVVVPTKAAWDWHGSEESLRDACERYGCHVPMTNQILHLLDLELVDFSAR